jgi:hypothetical protein
MAWKVAHGVDLSQSAISLAPTLATHVRANCALAGEACIEARNIPATRVSGSARTGVKPLGTGGRLIDLVR